MGDIDALSFIKASFIGDYKMENPFIQRYIYNSKCKYYFISVLQNTKSSGPSWVRSGFLTKDEVFEFLSRINTSKKEWTDLEIYSEDKLATKVSVEVDGQRKEITLREFFFGDLYAASGHHYERLTTDGAELQHKVGFDIFKSIFISETKNT